MKNTQAMARAAFEKAFYNAICTVYELQKEKDDETKQTVNKENIVLESQECRLSFERQNAAAQTDTAAALKQGTKLFIAPEITIKGGSKIVVTQNGHTQIFSCSGESAVYPTHQEVMLDLFKEWA